MARPIGHALAAPRRGLAAFFGGLSFPFQGARLVYVRHPEMIRYWIVPLIVTLAALVGSVTAVVAYEGALTSSLWDTPVGEGFDVDLARVLHSLFEVLVVIALGIGALAATLLVSGIVSAPFNARLAEVLDERVTGRVAPPFAFRRVLRDVGRAIVIETTFFAVNAVLLVLSLFVPAISPITGVLGLVFGALYFGISYVETPQATRDRSLRDRARLVQEHPMALLGFGAGVGLFLCVPLLNLLFMPAAVAGGVLFHAALEASRAPREPREP